jgi:hypothetical protein
MTDANPSSAGANGEAWRSFCARLAAVGDLLVGEGYPTSERDRAEGYRHLANQVACWLTYGLGHADPRTPAFFRSSDPVFQWGGPNADQVARRAAIAGEGVYRVSGKMGCCDEFVLQVKTGATQSGGAEIETEVLASALGIGPGDDFAIVLGGPPAPGTWLPMSPEATFVHIRDYYFGWEVAEPATFVIERLDAPAGAHAPLTGDEVADMLANVAAEVEHSIPFWNQYQMRMRAAGELNTFGVPAPAGRGVQDVLYSHAFVALRPDEALVVELHPSPDQLWDIQLYNRAWYEALDFRHRLTCLNHRLACRSHDDSVRIVITGRDPGRANWLDTEGRDEVLATIRWWHPPDTPTVVQRVVPTDELPDLPPVTSPQRQEEISRRTAHTAWRYRT